MFLIISPIIFHNQDITVCMQRMHKFYQFKVKLMPGFIIIITKILIKTKDTGGKICLSPNLNKRKCTTKFFDHKNDLTNSSNLTV